MSKPLPFTKFVRDVLRVNLTSGQRVLAKVFFDRLEPIDLEGDERDIALEMFGGVASIPENARRVLALVCGRASGKTFLLGLASIYAALVTPVEVARGERAFVLLVSADIRYSRNLLRLVAGMARDHASIRSLIVSESADVFVMRRPDGIEVAIECLPAGDSGRQIRGRTILLCVIDEAEFTRVELDELVSAALPRVVPSACVVMASTPWHRGGWLHKLFDDNWGQPRHALAARATTAAMRVGDVEIEKMLASELARDPRNHAREYLAQWVASGATYIDGDAIDRCIDRDGPLILEHVPGAATAIGFDAAFRRDGFGVVVVQAAEGGHIDVARVELTEPKPGAPLVPSECYALVIDLAKKYRCTHAVCDGHALPAAQEALGAAGISVEAVGTSAQSKVAIYTRLREVIHGRKLGLPPSGPLETELRQITAQTRPGGGLNIESPRRPGSHGDTVSALAAALHGLETRTGATALHAAFIDINTRLRAVGAGRHWGGGF